MTMNKIYFKLMTDEDDDAAGRKVNTEQIKNSNAELIK